MKLSLYLKKHWLKPIHELPGIFYITRRKGKKRLDVSRLDQIKKNLYNWEYWEYLINKDGEGLYQIEEERINDRNRTFRAIANFDYNLKPRQNYAVENARGRVLDVGAFDGKTLCYLWQKGFDCEGVDFGNTYLDIARENFIRVGGDPQKIVKGLFQKLPFEDNRFDTVISQETLEHFFFPEVMTKEIGRVLKNGGRFIGSTPLENRIDAETHILYYKLEGVKNLLLDAGFGIKDLVTIKNRPEDHDSNIIIWMAQKR